MMIYIFGEVKGMKMENYFTQEQVVRAFRTLNRIRFIIK